MYHVVLWADDHVFSSCSPKCAKANGNIQKNKLITSFTSFSAMGQEIWGENSFQMERGREKEGERELELEMQALQINIVWMRKL